MATSYKIYALEFYWYTNISALAEVIKSSLNNTEASFLFQLIVDYNEVGMSIDERSRNFMFDCTYRTSLLFLLLLYYYHDSL